MKQMRLIYADMLVVAFDFDFTFIFLACSRSVATYEYFSTLFELLIEVGFEDHIT